MTDPPAADRANYDLLVPNEGARRFATAWLALALVSLVAAGLYSVLLVLARTPAVQELIPLVDFFRIALVVHVDLSILIWMLSVSGALWSLSSNRQRATWDRASFSLAAAGTGIIIVSPFVGAGDPLMNNYIPLLRHPVFYSGLGLFGVGITSHLLRCVISPLGPGRAPDGPGALRVGITASAVITGVAIAAFMLSFAGMPVATTGEIYFEFLFWGGGHVLQFSYTLLMMVAWLVLAHGSDCRIVLTPRLTLVFLVMLALPVITVPFLYLAHDVLSPGHRLAFTELMKYGGLSCLPLGLAVIASLWNAPNPQGEGRHLRAALESSILLFTAGGVLGFLISGLDVVIPAHYHGSTVGVTIAFMGLTYYLLPRLGFAPVPPRLAFWQPYIYAGGQFMHVVGLAWTGGYGVQRKTAGLAQGVDRIGEIAGMGLMGLGGLVSVIGGFLFLVVAYLSIRQSR